MRVVLITQGVSRVVEPLVHSQHTVVGIIESAPRSANTRGNSRAVEMLDRYLRQSGIITRGLKAFCRNHRIPYRLMVANDDPKLIEWLKNLAPDIIVVHGMSQLLKRSIFSVPVHGTVNLHASFLPEYRGPNPDFWQYHDMVLDPGVTIHYIDDGEDTGDIIAQSRVRIEPGVKSPDRLNALVGTLGIRLLLDVLDSISTGGVKRTPQPTLSPTRRARNLKVAEHRTIINWGEWPIERVWHVLRGTESWLNALPYATHRLWGTRWLIGPYERRDTAVMSAVPGSIMRAADGHYVICRDGVIRIERERPTLKRFVKGIVTLIYQKGKGIT